MYDGDYGKNPAETAAESLESIAEEIKDISRHVQRIDTAINWIAGCAVVLTALAIKHIW